MTRLAALAIENAELRALVAQAGRELAAMRLLLWDERVGPSPAYKSFTAPGAPLPGTRWASRHYRRQRHGPLGEARPRRLRDITVSYQTMEELLQGAVTMTVPLPDFPSPSLLPEPEPPSGSTWVNRKTRRTLLVQRVEAGRVYFMTNNGSMMNVQLRNWRRHYVLQSLSATRP